MGHHKQTISIKKVKVGDKEMRNLGGDAYVRGVIPQDGFIILISSGGVSNSIYITNSDIEAAQSSKIGEAILAKSWLD